VIICKPWRIVIEGAFRIRARVNASLYGAVALFDVVVDCPGDMMNVNKIATGQL
jgi:hypothetical protein